MATSTLVWIVVAVVAAVLVLGALVWVARNRRNERRHIEAGEIRDLAEEESFHVGRREALADEATDRARVARAEADAMAEEAAELQQRAADRRHLAAHSREELNRQWDRADTIDPASSTPEEPRTGRGDAARGS
ncbi:hypothetical protein G4H71_13080 [Rhodococcus triatomae]|uniref:Uncharacterized protein n=1 Tax=Rhodococcus triatomae TaxID=300028 RepID=A0A1G8GZF8_9NOCA|nr:hypothetical protein [Rhodococcus triatomae]QNG20253.1 hypothetical protein G4H72_17300 [Rhodococcus triatomae]QNG23832.1 hypothetical protein G4H71_13080 [Rhodococcus triatomae]SDH99788.1 hypothetical protein SAMN05444695_104258 [Rhodococcus triatomae]